MTDRSLSIILPVFNESKNLFVLIPQINQKFKNSKYNIQIIIVDDDSNDDIEITLKKLNNLDLNSLTVLYYKRTRKRSLPLSIFHGIEISEFDNVMWLDADGSMSANSIFDLTEKYFESSFDVVIGSRYVEGGGYKGIKKVGETNIFNAMLNVNKSNDSISGMLLSLLLNKILVYLSGSEVKDITSGFIITDKKYLKIADFENCDYGEYFIKVIYSLQLQKLKIYEQGYLCETRMYGESKTGTNLFKLIFRGIGYIKVALKYRIKI